MKVQLTLLFIAVIILSCGIDKKTGHINGDIENAPDTTTLFLFDLENKSLFDSIRVLNGKIEYSFPISHPKYFLLHNERNQNQFRDRKFIWLEASNIKINGDFEFLKNLKMEGSESQMEFENYNLMVDDATKQINKLKEQIYSKTDEEKIADTLKIEMLTKNLSDSIVGFMLTHPSSYVTLSSLYNECYFGFFRHLNKNQIGTVYNHLPDILKKSKQGIEIEKYFKSPEPPKIGDIAPEIEQKTPDGETVKLSDFRGKYVLVDFWASSCAPCRGSHKWLRQLYEKYNEKGFEILGVSSDTNKNKWVNAIKKDSIKWTNISNLKGWNYGAFFRYDIKAIPQNYLINPEGEIIKIRLCSETYANNVLKEIFGDNEKNSL